LKHNGGQEFATMLSNTQPADFEQLFESAPISLWLEDYSALKAL
jgi:hypothetical protein